MSSTSDQDRSRRRVRAAHREGARRLGPRRRVGRSRRAQGPRGRSPPTSVRCACAQRRGAANAGCSANGPPRTRGRTTCSISRRPRRSAIFVALARSRWPIEQQYRELKDDLGLAHFEGRTYQGWTHHVVLTAVAFTFLQIERGRATDDAPRPARRPRNHGATLRAPQSAGVAHARQLPPERASPKVTM
jgi:Transposase DDE domain